MLKVQTIKCCFVKCQCYCKSITESLLNFISLPILLYNIWITYIEASPLLVLNQHFFLDHFEMLLQRGVDLLLCTHLAKYGSIHKVPIQHGLHCIVAICFQRFVLNVYSCKMQTPWKIRDTAASLFYSSPPPSLHFQTLSSSAVPNICISV